MKKSSENAIRRCLAQFITPERRRRVREVVRLRTRHVALVLEDIHKAQNASATLRTCECLGIQDVYSIENKNRFVLDKEVTLGASRWITMHRYRAPGADNTAACFRVLRQKGYRIIATVPGSPDIGLEGLDIGSPLAVVFGNEVDGLSSTAVSGADARMSIPLYGFTRSYNITVSVGIVLAAVISRLRNSDIVWQLPREEQNRLILQWYRKIVRGSRFIEKRFREHL